MKSTPAAPGYDEVLVAGDPEWRTEAERRENGIPIAEGNWEVLVKTAARVNVAVPADPTIPLLRIRGRHSRCSRDIARFTPVEEFKARVEQLVHLMKSTPTAPGYDEVMAAGDPEWRTEAERLRNVACRGILKIPLLRIRGRQSLQPVLHRYR